MRVKTTVFAGIPLGPCSGCVLADTCSEYKLACYAFDEFCDKGRKSAREESDLPSRAGYNKLFPGDRLSRREPIIWMEK